MTLNSRVLVLNKNWTPINVTTACDAAKKVWNNRALFVDVQTYGVFDFESWVINWDDAIRTAKIAEDKVIPLSGINLLIPDAIVCTEYRGFGVKMNDRRKPKFSRTNLYARDRCRCQFCGKKFLPEELTMDHVIPKSKGGKVTWTNIVLACSECNLRKSNKTLAESGMKLLRAPFEPTAEDLKRSPVDKILRRIGRKVPKTWEQFLGKMSVDRALSKMYWNVELDSE